MLAKVKTNALFKGKVYAEKHPLTCYADFTNTMEFTLPISLTGSECGTVSKVSFSCILKTKICTDSFMNCRNNSKDFNPLSVLNGLS